MPSWQSRRTLTTRTWWTELRCCKNKNAACTVDPCRIAPADPELARVWNELQSSLRNGESIRLPLRMTLREPKLLGPKSDKILMLKTRGWRLPSASAVWS